MIHFGNTPSRDSMVAPMSREYEFFQIIPLKNQSTGDTLCIDLDYAQKNDHNPIEVTTTVMQLQGATKDTVGHAVCGFHKGGWYIEAVHCSGSRAIEHASMHGVIRHDHWAPGDPSVYPHVLTQIFLNPIGEKSTYNYVVVYKTSPNPEDHVVLVNGIDEEALAVVEAIKLAKHMNCEIVPAHWQIHRGHPLLHGKVKVVVQVIVEKGDSCYGLRVPPLHGMISAADTMKEIRGMVQKAVEGHLSEMKIHGIDHSWSLPKPGDIVAGDNEEIINVTIYLPKDLAPVK